MKTFLPLLSTSFIVLSAVLVAFGWYYILKGRRETHQKLMVLAAISAVLFFTLYLSRTLILGSTPFNGPDGIKTFYLIFLLFHIVLAMVAAVMGIVTLVLAYQGKFLKHRRIGRPTAIIWFCTAITGLTVYLLLYVIYPPADTTHLMDAIFG